MKKISILFFVIIVFFSCEKEDIPTEICLAENFKPESKIKGGSILQTWLLFHSSSTHEEDIISTTNLAQKTNSNWVSLSPVIRCNRLGRNPSSSL